MCVPVTYTIYKQAIENTIIPGSSILSLIDAIHIRVTKVIGNEAMNKHIHMSCMSLLDSLEKVSIDNKCLGFLILIV
jgi:hypothetical protein